MASDPDPQPASAAEALERLGRLSLRELSMDGLLQQVADLTSTVLPGRPETSILLLVKDRPTTVVHTGELALDLDEVQYEANQGPCLHAARTGELAEITDTRSETRWPDYVRRAVERGNLSSLSIPLLVDREAQVSGALNIYARQANAFDEAGRSFARRFGPYAAVAVGNLHAYLSVRDLADNLQRALESRAVIDQAKGILVERHKITPDAAFQLLTRASMSANRKVRDIADDLVRTGEFPLQWAQAATGAGGRRVPGGRHDGAGEEGTRRGGVSDRARAGPAAGPSGAAPPAGSR